MIWDSNNENLINQPKYASSRSARAPFRIVSNISKHDEENPGIITPNSNITAADEGRSLIGCR
jgi:hypothetical protein